ncbi:MAG: isoprenylcysteine carboxylmethyltransferase family protein [Patescibacteria group bacterium]
MNSLVKKYVEAGRPFQMGLILSFLYRGLRFAEETAPLYAQLMDLTGMCIVALYMILIYGSRGRHNLITTGLFKYTRHPMYTGFVLIEFRFWFAHQYPWDFWVSAVIFWGSIITAGLIQEKETLAKFGPEAEEYYKKTPRIFLFYPLKKLATQ